MRKAGITRGPRAPWSRPLASGAIFGSGRRLGSASTRLSHNPMGLRLTAMHRAVRRGGFLHSSPPGRRKRGSAPIVGRPRPFSAGRRRAVVRTGVRRRRHGPLPAFGPPPGSGDHDGARRPGLSGWLEQCRIPLPQSLPRCSIGKLFARRHGHHLDRLAPVYTPIAPAWCHYSRAAGRSLLEGPSAGAG
jgi:hypothetical protein